MRIKVTFEMELEGDPKHEDITEWLLFEVGETYAKKTANPIKQELEAENTSWYPADF